MSKSTYRKLEALVDALAEDNPKLDRRIKCAKLQIRDGSVVFRMRRLGLADLERWFWSMLVRNVNTNCWEWTGMQDEHGYGRVKVGGRVFSANRMALIYVTGQDDRSLFACHTCDNPPCASPFHLFWGTQAENTKDMWSKGRGASCKGIRNPNCKLTEQQVAYLRSGIAPLVYLARHVGISYHHAWKIKSGWNWKTRHEKTGEKP